MNPANIVLWFICLYGLGCAIIHFIYPFNQIALNMFIRLQQFSIIGDIFQVYMEEEWSQKM